MRISMLFNPRADKNYAIIMFFCFCFLRCLWCAIYISQDVDKTGLIHHLCERNGRRAYVPCIGICRRCMEGDGQTGLQRTSVWQMPFNGSKFTVMHVRCRNTFFNFTMRIVNLTAIDRQRDMFS